MTNYEIRDRDDSGIFITFDTLPEANQWLADMKTRYPKRVIEDGMHVFKHEFKTELEQYEKSGLTPAEVEELAQAKADGRIVELPCKVGDTVKVDVRSWGNVYGFKTTEFGTYLIGKIVSITITKKQTLIKIQAQHNVAWKRERKRYPISAIGKTVFRTKAEAQAALDRMEGKE